MSSAPTSPPDGPPPGFRVNGYELLHRIGAGGMGVVHLARRPGEVRVALKVLRPQVIGDDEGRARLAQEVSSLSRIRSPRVAEIVDADPWGDIPYVATRYVPGWSLHDVVKAEGPLPAEDLDHFAGELVEAMAVVHAVGVVHRDIKPSNVLLEGRNPVLIDFGLARVADDPRLTHTGYMLGTPGYLAPEILYGEEATAASDVHSWAATVAFAALGRPPFGGGPALAVMDRVRRGEHDLTGLPEPLAGLLDRALDPDPTRRPTVRELRAWFSGEEPLTAVHQVPAPAPAPVPAHEPLPTMPMTLEPRSFDGAQGPADPMGAPDPSDAVTTRLADPTTRWETAGVTTPFHPATAAAQPGYAAVPPGADHPQGQASDDFPRWPDGQFVAQQEAPRTVGERVRAGFLTVGLVAVLTGVVTLAPVAGLAAITALVWGVRSASLVTQAHQRRRDVRGVKWYDGAQNVVGTPWYLVRALPGALVLTLWGAGMSVAALLLCYALSAPAVLSLVLAGAVFSAALWLGPGTDRWSGPVGRAAAGMSRDLTSTALAFTVLVVLACVLVAAAQVDVHWWPWSQAPVDFLR